MNARLTQKLFILFLVLSIAFPILSTGCEGAEEGLSEASFSSKSSAFLVPNTRLDVYVYVKQERPITVPAEMINMPDDIDVESLSIWGVPAEDRLAFGFGLVFANDNVASDIYSRIVSGENNWKMLRGNNIYLVQGAGIGAESLKTAISNNDFKYYDDGDVIEAITMLPYSGRTKRLAIAVAKPSDEVVGFIAGHTGKRDFRQLNNVLQVIKLDMMIAGIYSPHRINIARVADMLRKGDDIYNLDMGMLVLVKSSLPGFVVRTVVKNVLTEYGFVETKLGELTLYKGFWDTSEANSVPVSIRVQDNYVFVAVSGQEAYAETLIMSVYK